jgi:hypothetical protein
MDVSPGSRPGFYRRCLAVAVYENAETAIEARTGFTKRLLKNRKPPLDYSRGSVST